MGNDSTKSMRKRSTSVDFNAKSTIPTFTSPSFTNDQIRDVLFSDYGDLASIHQELIKKISTKLAEISLENFICLSKISKDYIRFTSGKGEDDKEFLDWLINFTKTIYIFQKKLRNYRSTISNLGQQNQELQTEETVTPRQDPNNPQKIKIQEISKYDLNRLIGMKLPLPQAKNLKISLGKCQNMLVQGLDMETIFMKARNDNHRRMKSAINSLHESKRSILSKLRSSSKYQLENRNFNDADVFNSARWSVKESSHGNNSVRKSIMSKNDELSVGSNKSMNHAPRDSIEVSKFKLRMGVVSDYKHSSNLNHRRSGFNPQTLALVGIAKKSSQVTFPSTYSII